MLARWPRGDLLQCLAPPRPPGSGCDDAAEGTPTLRWHGSLTAVLAGGSTGEEGGGTVGRREEGTSTASPRREEKRRRSASESGSNAVGAEVLGALPPLGVRPCSAEGSLAGVLRCLRLALWKHNHQGGGPPVQSSDEPESRFSRGAQTEMWIQTDSLYGGHQAGVQCIRVGVKGWGNPGSEQL